MQSWALALVPVGCACSALGLLLIKSAAPAGCLSPRWALGFLLLGVCATAVDVVVLKLLPLSIIAPFAGLTIVFSMLIASTGVLFPPELMSQRDLLSTLVVVLGLAIIGASSPPSGDTPSVTEITRALSSGTFVLPALATLAAAVWQTATGRAPCAVSSASNLAVVQSAYLAASCATISQMMLKLAATAVSESAWAALAAALAGLGTTAPIHLHLLNQTLAGGAASLAVPFYQTLLILLSATAGGVLFGEFASLSTFGCVVYASGLCVATGGLVALTASDDEELEPLDGEAPSSSEEELGAEPIGELWRIEEELEGSPRSSAADVAVQERTAHTARVSLLMPRRRSSAAPRASLGRARRHSTVLGTGLGMGIAISEAIVTQPGAATRSRAVTAPHLSQGLEAVAPALMGTGTPARSPRRHSSAA